MTALAAAPPLISPAEIPSPDRALVGGLLHPDARDIAPDILAALRAEDFDEPLGPVVAMLKRDGLLPMPVLVQRLEEEHRRGDWAYQVALIDEDAGLPYQLQTLAQRVREAVWLRRERGAHSVLALDPRSEHALAALDAVECERKAHSGESGLDVLAGAFTGDTLRAMRERPESVSPMPGLLDPEPHLHLLQGKPKSGKTTLALAIARAWACGAPPWEAAKPLPGSRVLVVSREQNVNRIDATLRRLDRFAFAGDRETWTERLAIVARDPALGRDLRRLLTLDQDGLALLRGALRHAKAEGDPVGLVVLDSLSRLIPAEMDENSPRDMTVWLDGIEALAEHCGVYVLLIHHAGHSTDPARSEARSAGRGASSIAAVAQGAWLLERLPASPRHRRLKVDGNAILPAEIMFEVADTTADEGAIHYFRPSEAASGEQPEQYLQPGETISTNALAWRLAGNRDGEGNAPGMFSKKAGALRNRWKKAGSVIVTEGKRHAKLISLARERSAEARPLPPLPDLS